MSTTDRNRRDFLSDHGPMFWILAAAVGWLVFSAFACGVIVLAKWAWYLVR